jgi:hypothetical protein
MGQLAGDIQDLLARDTARNDYTSMCSPDRKRQKEDITLNPPTEYQVTPPVIDSPMAETPPEVPDPRQQ